MIIQATEKYSNSNVRPRHLLQLVTIRQFPPADKSLPPLNKSKWWIPTATKVDDGDGDGGGDGKTTIRFINFFHLLFAGSGSYQCFQQFLYTTPGNL